MRLAVGRGRAPYQGREEKKEPFWCLHCDEMTGGDDIFAGLCSNSKLERDRAEVDLDQAVAEREVVVVQAVSDAATALQDGKPRQ